MASIRSLVRDQENAQVGFHSKNGAQGSRFLPKTTEFHFKNSPFYTSCSFTGRTNGPAKGLRFQSGLETPRRALGDVGNIFKTPGNVSEKSTLLKPNQQQHLKATKQKIKSTPLGSHKQKSSVKSMRREVLGEKEHSYEKERMIPYLEDGKFE